MLYEVITNQKKVHLIGLIGPGGVHALSAHMVALCQMATDLGLSDVFIHSYNFV